MVTTHADPGSRWRVFAGVMVLLVGTFNFIDGIVAIANPHYYYYYVSVSGKPAAVTHHLVFGDLTARVWTMSFSVWSRCWWPWRSSSGGTGRHTSGSPSPA